MRAVSSSGGIMNIKVKKSVSVIERVILAVIAVLIASVVFALSAQAKTGTTDPGPAPVTVGSPAPMGPAAPVGNVVALPEVAWANCFNVYRNGTLIAPCVKGFQYIDASPEVAPATRWTYEVSAVNDTGESPRIGQGGPYPSSK